jgi:hypothetical protein
MLEANVPFIFVFLFLFFPPAPRPMCHLFIYLFAHPGQCFFPQLSKEMLLDRSIPSLCAFGTVHISWFDNSTMHACKVKCGHTQAKHDAMC